MFFWWICGRESGLPVLFLHHLPNCFSRGCFRTPQFTSIDQSCLTLLPHGLQNIRPPCPSPTLVYYSNSWPLSRWCHLTISSSVVSSSCLQSFPAHFPYTYPLSPTPLPVIYPLYPTPFPYTYLVQLPKHWRSIQWKENGVRPNSMKADHKNSFSIKEFLELYW